ncbi:MAG: putative phage tail protein [Hydrogenoanaerobacterium sp.]
MFSYTDYLPAYLQNIKDFTAIGGAVDKELIELQAKTAQLNSNQCISTADLETQKRWENILLLPHNPVLTLEERRMQLLSRLQMQPGITLLKLAALLKQMTNGGATAALESDKYLLKVRVALTSRYSFNNVNSLLHEVVPANIVIDLSLLYNKNETLSHFTNARLSKFTHKQLRETVFRYNTNKVLSSFTNGKLEKFTNKQLREDIF